MLSSGVQTPQTGKELALNSQWKLSSGVQTLGTSKELASNATPASNPGIQMPVRDQTLTSADNNPSKKASPTTFVGNKPAATKVEEYKAKMPYPQNSAKRSRISNLPALQTISGLLK